MSIAIEDDDINESLEQFFTSLTFINGDSNTQFSPLTAVVMIADDDGKDIHFIV